MLVKSTSSTQADMGVSDKQGRTALHYAVTCNSLPCVQAIVETNVEVHSICINVLFFTYVCLRTAK